MNTLLKFRHSVSGATAGRNTLLLACAVLLVAWPASAGVLTFNGIGTGAGEFPSADPYDVLSNCIVIHEDTLADGQAALAALETRIQAGFSSGQWNGGGINSSVAASDPNDYTAVGVALNEDLLSQGQGYTTYMGVPVNPQDIIMRYTYYGDANQDGQTNASDLALYSYGFANGKTTWDYGDFNYDFKVDASDDSLLLYTYGLPQIPCGVPEPSTVALLSIGAIGLMRWAWRMRKRKPLAAQTLPPISACGRGALAVVVSIAVLAGAEASAGTLLLSNYTTIGSVTIGADTINLNGEMIITTSDFGFVPSGGQVNEYMVNGVGHAEYGDAAIHDALAEGANYVAGSAGYWNGTNGITSTAAASDQDACTGVGWIDNSIGLYTSFLGVPVGRDQSILAYTYYGDANLDGVANNIDLTFINATMSQPPYPTPQVGLYGQNGGMINGEPEGVEWVDGDFDQSGRVDNFDLSLWQACEGETPLYVVPEPSALALLAVGLLMVIRPRVLFGPVAVALAMTRRQRKYLAV